MKRLVFVTPLFLIFACSFVPQEVVVVTATPPPATSPPEPTEIPTERPAPTQTPVPTSTAAPTWEPFEVGDVEAALREDGYRRFPFTNEDGVTGFYWVNDNSFEQVTTWDDGTVEIQILHDGSANTRTQRMERHLAVLDEVLPRGFMEQLRQEHAAYNRSVPSSVTGEPEEMNVYGGDWKTIWAEYNADGEAIGGYEVRFSLWWLQSTCPPQYDYCYYDSFPGLEFTGDSSFIFHTITIWPPNGNGLFDSNS